MTGSLIYNVKNVCDAYSKYRLAALVVISLWMFYGLRDNLIAFGSTYIILIYVIWGSVPKLPLLCSIIEYLGIVSFPWYLVHQFIGYSILMYWCPAGNLSLAWLLLPVSITLLLAMIINYLSLKIVIKI